MNVRQKQKLVKHLSTGESENEWFNFCLVMANALKVSKQIQQTQFQLPALVTEHSLPLSLQTAAQMDTQKSQDYVVN